MAHTDGIARLCLLTRSGCDLCDEMLSDLQTLNQHWPLPELAIQDVDADPELQRRYGLRVPVLLLDGSAVCHGHLDGAELRRMLRPR